MKKPVRGAALGALNLCLMIPLPLAAQVDQQRAADYFKEAARLCEREGGKLWGVSLCGPMVIADAASRTVATNQPAPQAPWPRALGYANTALKWGDERWSTFAWQWIPADDEGRRGRLWLHELFHRIQPQLGLFISAMPGENDHLDTPEGRYWIQLEWRALARALGSSGAERSQAIEDVLAFRLTRRELFPGSAHSEQASEINEGLAQYTGTVAAFTSTGEVVADAIGQLAEYAQMESFVRTFAYPSGAAYGILLDGWSPGWTRQIKADDDLGQMLMQAARIQPTQDAKAAALRYGGPELRVAEQMRETDRKARVAELRQRFVEGPVLVLPRGRNAFFMTAGVTPIPGAGTVLPSYRVTGEWGTLEADIVLVSPDGSQLTVPAPNSPQGPALSGPGWTVTLSPGWLVRTGPREGDYQVVRQDR